MGAFLRDYASLFPVVIAVTNGVVAVISAHYPFRKPSAKMAFIAIILSLSASAVGANFYSQYLVNAEKATAAAHRALIRERFGTFIQDGNTLMRQCDANANPVPIEG